MAKLLSVFLLQVLSGTFRPSLLQSPPTDLKSARPGENVTLSCNITADYEFSWYHQSSEEMKLLISGGRQKLNKQFSLSFNVDEDHYDGSENTSSLDLVIMGVNESDSGLYFCGGRNQKLLLRFGRGIRLNVAGEDTQKPTYDPVPFWIIAIILSSALLVSVIMNISCMCVLCYRAQGRCCGGVGPDDRTQKVPEPLRDGDLQYASLQHTTVTGGAARGTPASTRDSVTYSGIISRPRGQPV